MIFILLPIISYGQLCPQGNYLKSSYCERCPTNCLSCTDGTRDGYPCEECESNPCNGCGKIYNCLRCDQDPIFKCKCACLECMNNWILEDGIFRDQCDSTCSNCISGQWCLCKFGMYTRNNKCFHCSDYCQNCYWNYHTNQTECSKCQDYFYSDKQGNCQPCDKGCKNCVEVGGSQYCLNCDQDKYLMNGQCFECSSKGCKTCIYDTEVKCLNEKENCKENIPNCKSCEVDIITSQNKCLDCAQGYYENQGLCVNCQNDCLVCKSKTQCLTCEQNFYLDLEQNCKTCAHPCKSCNGPIGADCKTCVNGYFLSSNTCYTYQNKFWILLFISILSIYIFQLVRQLCKYTQQRYTQIRNNN